jgi:4-hydroxybenzoate polyprenyltransferase
MLEVVPNLVLFALVTAFAFVINQISDIEVDAVNRKNFILPSGLVSRAEGIAFAVGICVVAVAMSLSVDSTSRYLVWIGLVLGFAYSTPPIRLKGRPLGDVLANIAGFGLIGFAMGWLVFSQLRVDLVLRSMPYGIAMGAIFLNTCIPDEEGDRAVGDRTSCVAFGRKPVTKAALVLMFGAFSAGIITDELLCSLAALGSTPAFVALAVEPTPRSSVIASQFAARLLFGLVCIRAPILALIGLISFAGAKIYYNRRLGVDYPRLTGAEVKEVSSTSW